MKAFQILRREWNQFSEFGNNSIIQDIVNTIATKWLFPTKESYLILMEFVFRYQKFGTWLICNITLPLTHYFAKGTGDFPSEHGEFRQFYLSLQLKRK